MQPFLPRAERVGEHPKGEWVRQRDRIGVLLGVSRPIPEMAYVAKASEETLRRLPRLHQCDGP
jgi:hypothetical protein